MACRPARGRLHTAPRVLAQRPAVAVQDRIRDAEEALQRETQARAAVQLQLEDTIKDLDQLNSQSKVACARVCSCVRAWAV
jgi:hypothetical protein